MRQKWNAGIIISAIQDLHSKRQKLNSDFAQKNYRTLYLASCNYLGGWKQAIEATGIPYDSVRVKKQNRKVVWNKEIVVHAIQDLKKREPINSNHVQINHLRLYAAACKYFGSWGKAIEAAGFDYSRHRKKLLRSWSKIAIVDEIIRRAELKLSINGATVTLEDRGLYTAARRHFGKSGWAKARLLAGFTSSDPVPWKKWDQSNVIDEINRLHTEGVSLHALSMQSDARLRRVQSAGVKVFGSWKKAIRAAGLDYSKIRQSRHPGWWTKPRILMCIKSLEKREIRLSSKSIHHSHGGLFSAAILRFGSWSEAVEAAGISYRKHLRIWSSKAWLRRMRPEEYRSTLESANRHALTRRSRR